MILFPASGGIVYLFWYSPVFIIKGVEFSGATFEKAVDFSYAKFLGVADEKITGFADFQRAYFRSGAKFRETQFRSDGPDGGGIGAVFSETRFECPEQVLFYKTYLGQVLFHNCDVSKFAFSNVEWRRRENGKRMVFEEVVRLEDAPDLKLPEGTPDKLNYELIAELYQQMKKNYDDRRDYWTAGDFHYGEMEMKRLSSRRHNRVLRWLHRNLGLTTSYKYASDYGESYRRPAELLGLVLLLFTALYPWAGFQMGNEEKISYEKFVEGVGQGNWWDGLALIGHSLLTTVSVMALQRDVIQALSYPWGRVLALLELLLTSTLIALFLLAVRRQFRR